MFLKRVGMYLHLSEGVLTCYGLGTVNYHDRYMNVIFYRQIDKGISEIDTTYNEIYIQPHNKWLSFHVSTYFSMSMLVYSLTLSTLILKNYTKEMFL